MQLAAQGTQVAMLRILPAIPTVSRFSLGLILGLLPLWANAQTIHVSIQGQEVEGKPIFWQKDFVALMERDGKLVTFSPKSAKDFRQVSKSFNSHTQSTLRGELLAEFGRGFDVTGTGHYLVVHPAGQRDQWADRFELLYRSMLHYFQARSFSLNNPEFPLIAVVFPSQQQYLSFARKQGRNVSTATLGYYDPETNRIQMFDASANRAQNNQWFTNSETIIHEAAHQTAFNVGIHSRLAVTPRWVIEGLGTLFEASGVWDSRSNPELSTRINRVQLDYYRKRVNGRNSLDLLNVQIASDRIFQNDPSLAYAHAWAMTFYLTEQLPRPYATYLRLTRDREAFADYPREARVKDFMRVFGSDLKMFDARMQRFLTELK